MKYNKLSILIFLIFTLIYSTTTNSSYASNLDLNYEISDPEVGEIDLNANDIHVYKVENAPDVTDGQKGIWENIPPYQIEVKLDLETILVDFYAVHNGSRIYFAYEYHDPTVIASGSTDAQTIILDIDEDLVWNQLDGSYLDYLTSAWYFGGGSALAYDWYWQDIYAQADTEDSGETNAIGNGEYNYDTQSYFFEISQEMDSSDDLHDVSLVEGDSILGLIGIHKDNDAYLASIKTFIIESTYLDLLSPEITFLTQDNIRFSTSNVNIEFSTSENTSWMVYSLNGLINQTIEGNFSLNSLSDGLYTLQIFAEDNNGNEGSSNILTFYVDTSFPVINIISPKTESTYSLSVWLNFSISEDVLWTKYSLDNGNNITIEETELMLTLTEGTYLITIYTIDLAGNVASKSLEFTIINTSTTSDNISTSETNSDKSEDIKTDSSFIPLNLQWIYLIAIFSLLRYIKHK